MKNKIIAFGLTGLLGVGGLLGLSLNKSFADNSSENLDQSISSIEEISNLSNEESVDDLFTREEQADASFTYSSENNKYVYNNGQVENYNAGDENKDGATVIEITDSNYFEDGSTIELKVEE